MNVPLFPTDTSPQETPYTATFAPLQRKAVNFSILSRRRRSAEIEDDQGYCSNSEHSSHLIWIVRIFNQIFKFSQTVNVVAEYPQKRLEFSGLPRGKLRALERQLGRGRTEGMSKGQYIISSSVRRDENPDLDPFVGWHAITAVAICKRVLATPPPGHTSLAPGSNILAYVAKRSMEQIR